MSLLLTLTFSASASEKLDVDKLFKQRCSLCHAINKKKLGPAIKTMSSEKEVLRQIIIKGKNSMPGYEGKLTSTEIDVLVNYLLANQ